MIGKAVALHCLQVPRVTEVVSLSRSSANISHPKFTEYLVKDFFDLSSVERSFDSIDACFFALGVSSLGKSEQEYSRITYDLTLHVAQTLVACSPNAAFVYVSGMGTDSTASGKVMWARVKGKTEQALQQIGFRVSVAFRPGYIKPHPDAPSKTALYRIPLFFARFAHPLIAFLFPKSVTTTENIARAFLAVSTTTSHPKSVFEVRDMNEAASDL